MPVVVAVAVAVAVAVQAAVVAAHRSSDNSRVEAARAGKARQGGDSREAKKAKKAKGSPAQGCSLSLHLQSRSPGVLHHNTTQANPPSTIPLRWPQTGSTRQYEAARFGQPAQVCPSAPLRLGACSQPSKLVATGVCRIMDVVGQEIAVNFAWNTLWAC